MTPVIKVQAGDFDCAAETALLTKDRTDVGAVASFTGLCRSEGESLTSLELEHYPGMAEKQLEELANRAKQRWPLLGLTVIHRFGKIAPGEQIVLVIAASSHRDAAFEAARFVMDFLKTDAPFWKKEHRVDGTEGEWVDAKEVDDEARKRWS
ncbi:molybdenum cofactor biosynthesis protein MoaE [Ahrensia sp. AH-315-G08]|nr:molybdenum cofactor biosynthesis protein MoaE [Ahrensia sp. AH-315-G08]